MPRTHVRPRSVGDRVDVAAAREQQPVDAREHAVPRRLGQARRDDHRQAAGPLDPADDLAMQPIQGGAVLRVGRVRCNTNKWPEHDVTFRYRLWWGGGRAQPHPHPTTRWL